MYSAVGLRQRRHEAAAARLGAGGEQAVEQGRGVRRFEEQDREPQPPPPHILALRTDAGAGRARQSQARLPRQTGRRV